MSYQEFFSFEIDSQNPYLGIVRLNRPDKLNTISAPFYEAMMELQQTEIVRNTNLRAIAILAEGRHFSAGIDLNYARSVIGTPGRSLYGVCYWQNAYKFWHDFNLPVVVGIQGACLGTAMELVAACDFRIAAENAKFALKEVDVGISTDLGGTTRLTQLIGPGMTKLLAMTCEQIDVKEAQRIGLVERVVPLEELEEATLKYGRILAEKSPIAVQMCKKCINIAADSSAQVGLWAEEIQGIYTASTKDKAEASRAMMEKRPGNYILE
ncbi:MAG: enoyl-CoA hydratase/isomerase family protein [Oscillospiraceae bacterium]|nr:enoyl-CoA hydratase/isomerase family protein [Oscillospiraceae bacterium]